MAILILTNSGDPHAIHVQQTLQQRGADVELLDSTWFPQSLRYSRHSDPRRDALRCPSGRVVRIDEVTSIYWRNYNRVLPPELPDEEQTYIAFNDSRGLFESLLLEERIQWVNGWQGYRMHQTKPVAFQRVQQLGVRVPETVWTNDPLEVRAFLESNPRCIFKPVQGGAHTQRISKETLSPDALNRLSIAPITIQEEIAGTDIRVFVAGERVHACELETEAIDFRDDPHLKLKPCELPESVQEMSRSIARTLFLKWTGIDFRRTDAGEFVFLEANPSPMFMGFEEATGLPLADALCEVLLSTE